MAVVLAAGTGTRVGADGNKAYLTVAGRPMVAWSLHTLTHVAGVTRILLVHRRGERRLAEDIAGQVSTAAAIELVEGGDSRHGSELNALRYLAADIEAGAIDVVLIHDAARPVASPDMFLSALKTAREFGGAVPVLPLPDVLTHGSESIEAAALVRVQTPQAFRAAPLLEAYRIAEREGFKGTDTSSCIETFTDVEVRTFRGENCNIKVTYAPDIALAERLLGYTVSRSGDPR
ncbi:2-C-methyl-D-erythritol 4-phosphate cytidylyltransferase [Mycobacterium sp. IDR2000157661]|nr:2-C-methyl-D-erythritol 4-phosphate cytidylyltransferase [Mycobacterium sp. IDR2000157661]